ncbi:leucine Rich repeat-containing domain protein [Opisthorchis viverrini]|uniref:Leucine Rich repeat-containing domain protein n=1 Tax=Opisthorchis viverrini TaxID=6198 RepID=A0A1S8X7U8_OPIVI|nr:leucine Rich repeat-containing domain protein [Opisthorchis viverrini]
MLDQVDVGCHELREAIMTVMQIKQSYYRMQVQSRMALEERAANRLRTVYRKLSDKIYAQVEVLDKAARCLQAGIGPNTKSEATSECDRYLQIPWIKELGQRIFVWESLLKKCRLELATELQQLKKLKRLLLGNNSIQSFRGLRKSDFPNLEVLVVRANGIKEVDGIAVLVNLQELYIANNDLRELKVVLELKDLLLLTIADFSGNPLTKELNHYRLRMIFHLKSLKALDGLEISTNDTLRAKELLGGHLSEEFLMEKFNGENLSELVCLEICGNLLKVVDVLSPEYFSKLQSVNLERNNLTSFGGLLFLPQLRTLCLNENNIETLFPANIQLIASSSRRKLKDLADTRYVSLYTSKQAIFPKLKVLHLAKNHISTLLPLHFHRMPAIRSLFLQYNEISSFSGLESLPVLRDLVLDGNKIKEIPEISLQFRWSLQELHLESNRLRELYNLKSLENLKRVYLSGNKLYDLNDLERFSTIQKNLIEISLIDNPLTSRQIHRLILINGCLRVQVIDGIPVTPEERERCAAFYADIELQTLINTGLDTLLYHSGRLVSLEEILTESDREKQWLISSTALPTPNPVPQLKENIESYSVRNEKETASQKQKHHSTSAEADNQSKSMEGSRGNEFVEELKATYEGTEAVTIHFSLKTVEFIARERFSVKDSEGRCEHWISACKLDSSGKQLSSSNYAHNARVIAWGGKFGTKFVNHDELNFCTC